MIEDRRQNWLTAIRRYLVAVIIGNLLWETVQLPLYTLWNSGTSWQITAAVFHCTLGDIVIAIIALFAALIVIGSPAWPDAKFVAVMIAVVIGSAGYTIYSEYANTILRSSWAYSEWMPTLPGLGTGLAPLAQWMVVPAFALVSARRGGKGGSATGGKCAASTSPHCSIAVTKPPAGFPTFGCTAYRGQA